MAIWKVTYRHNNKDLVLFIEADTQESATTPTRAPTTATFVSIEEFIPPSQDVEGEPLQE
jgi:hypothetical protein